MSGGVPGQSHLKRSKILACLRARARRIPQHVDQIVVGSVLAVTATETFKFYVNGVKVDGIAGLNIAALSRVLISYGPESEDEVLRQFAAVTDEACIPQGICVSRGNGNGEHGEPEPCSGGTTCTG